MDGAALLSITADPNSYGFRSYRSCADAIKQCLNALAKKKSAQWVLEGDIKACFDTISNETNSILVKKMFLIFLVIFECNYHVFLVNHQG